MSGLHLLPLHTENFARVLLHTHFEVVPGNWIIG